ncbi:MAG TPA: radical SAM protein [Methanosarcina sp.]|nr:radical SAM protein [Methanosarcina sp.]
MRFESQIGLIKSPRILDIDITGRCNLGCTYCYYFSGLWDVPEYLSKEEWLKFFEELKKYVVMNVSIFAGL